ncbi:MAG: hypothetical protein GY928_17205 [Colwellia sp.]|nr:hypothetical protein [Colwellia sp.]
MVKKDKVKRGAKKEVKENVKENILKDAKKKAHETLMVNESVIGELKEYPELNDYIQNWFTHKKHLVFVNGKNGEAYDIGDKISILISGIYPYEKDRIKVSIPKITCEYKYPKGYTVYKRKDAFKEYINFGKCVIVDGINNKSYAPLMAYMSKLKENDILVIAIMELAEDSLPPSFQHLCEVFDLETGKFLDKQEKAKGDGQQEAKIEQDEKKAVRSKILFMDSKKNVLYFDKENIVHLTPKEIKLIKYMRNQGILKLEQILTENFGTNLTETYKHSKNFANIFTKPPVEEKCKAISKGDRNIFDVYKTNINKKCKSLDIGDLIINHKDIKKAYTLSTNITEKTLKL